MKKHAVALTVFLIVMALVLVGCSSKPAGTPAPPPNSPQASPGGNSTVAQGAYVPPETGFPQPGKPARRQRPSSPQLPGTLLAIIENSPMARPQAGLDRADVVFETLAEGGITRFMAVFYTEPAEKIGPIRSARYYFVEIAKAFGAPFAHAGGNEDALALIPAIRIRDMDEIYNSGAWFWRSTDRRSPHNLYTSTGKLAQGAKAKGFPMLPLDPLPTGQVEGGREVSEFRVTFYQSDKYTSSSGWVWRDGAYWKNVDGQPHILEGGTQISADNVVVLGTRMFDEKKEDWQVNIRVVGQGEAVFFTGGKAYQGTWRKASRESHFEFLYEGKPMKFAPGQTWIAIAPGISAVAY